MKPAYRFRLPWRQYKPGDAVPADFGGGVVDALLRSMRIEAVPASAERINIDLGEPEPVAIFAAAPAAVGLPDARPAKRRK
jgi:hypothetical protein